MRMCSKLGTIQSAKIFVGFCWLLRRNSMNTPPWTALVSLLNASHFNARKLSVSMSWKSMSKIHDRLNLCFHTAGIRCVLFFLVDLLLKGMSVLPLRKRRPFEFLPQEHAAKAMQLLNGMQIGSSCIQVWWRKCVLHLSQTDREKRKSGIGEEKHITAPADGGLFCLFLVRRDCISMGCRMNSVL